MSLIVEMTQYEPFPLDPAEPSVTKAALEELLVACRNQHVEPLRVEVHEIGDVYGVWREYGATSAVDGVSRFPPGAPFHLRGLPVAVNENVNEGEGRLVVSHQSMRLTDDARELRAQVFPRLRG